MNSNNQKISVIDFNKICRICMSKENLVNIFNKCETKDCIFEMLASCTLTMASEEDELPDKICLQCLDELKVAYKFYQKSEVTDNLLHKLLKKSKQTDQGKSSPSMKSENQTNEIPSVTIENNEIDLATIKNDLKVKLGGYISFNNDADNDHTYISPENVCENESTPDDTTEINCNQNDTDTDQTTNASETKNRSTHTCNKCSKTGFTYRQLRLHWMTAHGAKYAERECPICNKFIGFKEFVQHVRNHPQYKPYTCELCSVKFRLYSQLQRHRYSHKRKKCHLCDQCVKQYTTLENLRKHIAKHHSSSTNDKLLANDSSNSQGHVCHMCNRCFRRKSNLNKHVLDHGIKKYLCWICGKSFETCGSLKFHVKIHTGIKPYRCSYCPKSFISTSARKQHMYTHTGEKPHVCEYCSRPFAQRQQLKRHTRIHTGVKPYKCSLCEKCYTDSGTLKLHLRTHTGVTPYVCEFCPKGFYRSDHLKKHMKTHEKTQRTLDN